MGGRRALHDATGRNIGLWKLWISRSEEEILEMRTVGPPVGGGW